MNLLAEFYLDNALVHATLIDRDRYGGVMEGQGECIQDAISDALRDSRLAFASEEDERHACMAAMRSARAALRINARHVQFLELA